MKEKLFMSIKSSFSYMHIVIAILALAIIPNQAFASIIQLAAGFVLPENITPVPLGFGPIGSAYIVPDAGAGGVYTISSDGGSLTKLAATGNTIGGAFLPSTYLGIGGQYLAVGDNNGFGFATAVASNGGMTNVVTSFTQGGAGEFASVAIAPSGFGSLSGTALLSDTNTVSGDIFSLSKNGSIFTKFSDLSSFGANPFGLAFAPNNFGTVAGDLLASDGFDGRIYAINSSGVASLFATLTPPFVNGEITGLRQMAFAPAGFGSYGGDLFVSISGSQFGGGSLGSIVVLNDSGQEIADIIQGVLSTPIDPRGLYFANDQQLLFANADPGIDIADPSAFEPIAVREPGTLLLFSTGLFALLIIIRRRKNFYMSDNFFISTNFRILQRFRV